MHEILTPVAPQTPTRPLAFSLAHAMEMGVVPKGIRSILSDFIGSAISNCEISNQCSVASTFTLLSINDEG